MQLSSETPPPPVNQPPESNGLAVASFVLGLISTVSICICYISIPLAITVLIVVLGFICTLGMTPATTIGGFLYPNTIHRVELVHTRDNLGEIGWIRGGVMTLK